MDSFVFPMKVHAVKIAYRKRVLDEMPHGYFKVINGIQYVIVTSDPAMPKCNSRHPKRLKVNTRYGQMYSKRINEYLKTKLEYDSLLAEWNSIYNFAPPHVDFPIIQYFDPHIMNNEYFNKQEECLGKYVPENPTVSEYGDLKSKNELMGADLLKLMGIPFKYETELYLRSIDEMINPDYLVNFYEIDRCAYLELLGMSDKVGYSVRSATKITGFSMEKYRPGREVIYVLVYDKNNFEREYFISQVMTAFNNMIPDSALQWETNARAV